MSLSPLESLPNELLDHIISYISADAPSSGRLHQLPSLQLPQSSNRDLKHLAQTSTGLLQLVRPRLFAHVRLDPREENDFHSFIVNSDLGRYVTSIMVTGDDSPDRQGDPFWWRRVLQYLDPVRITILASPTFIGKTMGTPIMDEHSWAFGIDLQVLQLERGDPCGPLSSVLGPDSSLLSSRPWKSLSFNEASSLRAYNHYEYFVYKVPSVLGAWGEVPTSRHSKPELFMLGQELGGLRTFSYTAIFPFCNHVELVLEVLVMMRHLRCLSMQLAPEESNNILETEQRSSMDLSDPWMELENSYALIADTVCKSMKSLTEFRTRDYRLEWMQTELAFFFDCYGDSMAHHGHGIWRRP